ncbi:hypothetical protein YC2023_090018 [Brassica napus]
MHSALNLMRIQASQGVLIPLFCSPGPGTPQDSGISLQTVLEIRPHVPLFGVCMGLQCIGEAFGGKIVRSPLGVMHGKSSMVYYDEKDNKVCSLAYQSRYHSLVIQKDSFPSDELEVTAWTEDGLVMAARHRKHKHIQQCSSEDVLSPPETLGLALIPSFTALDFCPLLLDEPPY